MQTYFIIKNNYNNWLIGTIVKLNTNINTNIDVYTNVDPETNTYDTYYLVENINTGEKIWLINYDLYPIINHNINLHWSFDINYQKLISSNLYIIKNNKKVVKLLEINDDNNCIVLDLDNNKEIEINQNHLIQANKYTN